MKRTLLSLVCAAVLALGFSAFNPPSIYGCGGQAGGTGCKQADPAPGTTALPSIWPILHGFWLLLP